MSEKIITLAKRYVGQSGPGPIFIYEPVKCPACEDGRLQVDGYEGAPCGLCRDTGVLFEDGHFNERQARLYAAFIHGDAEERVRAMEEVLNLTDEMVEDVEV